MCRYTVCNDNQTRMLLMLKDGIYNVDGSRLLQYAGEYASNWF